MGIRGTTGLRSKPGAITERPRDVVQPAQISPSWSSGTVALVCDHLAAERSETTGTFILRAGELNHEVGTEGRKSTLLFGREGLPALTPHQG